MKKIFLAAFLAFGAVSVSFGWEYSDLECSYEEGCYEIKHKYGGHGLEQALPNPNDIQSYQFDLSGAYQLDDPFGFYQSVTPQYPAPRIR